MSKDDIAVKVGILDYEEVYNACKVAEGNFKKCKNVNMQ